MNNAKSNFYRSSFSSRGLPQSFEKLWTNWMSQILCIIDIIPCPVEFSFEKIGNRSDVVGHGISRIDL